MARVGSSDFDAYLGGRQLDFVVEDDEVSQAEFRILKGFVNRPSRFIH